MVGSFSTANPSHLFIDLATFSELEGFLYGGPDAITWFVGAVQKANWFSYLPTSLRHNGAIDFGAQNVSASVNRSGDYVMHVWFRCQIPVIELDRTGDRLPADAAISWTKNLGHNLFDRVSITFNELTIQEFDSYWLDMNYMFRIPASKRIGYNNMIGNVASFTSPDADSSGDGRFISVPLPFWFAEDSGIALPVAALPFNDIKINYEFRRWEDLVVVYPGTDAGAAKRADINDVYIQGSTTQRPRLVEPETIAHYAVVHNDERVKMGDAPRDILIHQVQSTQLAAFRDLSSRNTFDLRLSHSIVCFMFAAENITFRRVNGGIQGGMWSNYTTHWDPDRVSSADPISFTTLVYENTVRLAQGSDYFSLTHPYYMSDAIPDEPGYHMWSYALCPWDALRPSGSTNFSKLANVSISHDMSPAAQASAGIGTAGGLALDVRGRQIQFPGVDGALADMPQQYQHVFVAKNHNIARVANGSLGQPTL